MYWTIQNDDCFQPDIFWRLNWFNESDWIVAYQHSHLPLYRETRPRSAVGNMSDCRSRVASTIPAGSHAFVEIDHEMIAIAILVPSTDLRRVGVYYL